MATIRNPHDYFNDWLARRSPAEQRFLVLDPQRYLDLGSEYQAGSRSWPVFRYNGNDLNFRAVFGTEPPQGNFIVWVTPGPLPTTDRVVLDLSFIPDVLRHTDAVLDLSLTGILQRLAPGEVFPPEGLHAYGKLLSQRLDRMVSGYKALRERVRQPQPLNIHHVRALALHCLQPSIPITRLLFDQPHARDRLHAYLRLVWSERIDGEALEMLRVQAGQSPAVDETLASWFTAEPDQLALMVYAYRALRAGGVTHAVNHLRGLGLTSVDPGALPRHLDDAARLWDDEGVRPHLVQRAEDRLNGDLLTDLVQLLPALDLGALVQLVSREHAPALIFGQVERWLASALRDTALDQLVGQQFPTQLAVTTGRGFEQQAMALLRALREVAFIHTVLARAVSSAPDLSTLADDYIASEAYRLELALAQAEEDSKRASTSLGQAFRIYLAGLRRHIADYLARWDARLAELVGRDVNAFLGHPRLSTNVLLNTALRFNPTTEACLWVLVFDGMRWDTWQEVILPALTRVFEVVDEGKPYLSLLPSVTEVARTGLLAGCPPQAWRGANGRWTNSQEVLAARLFDLSVDDRRRKLRLETRSERDLVQRRLIGDEKRYPVSILIYNISDDQIHDLDVNLAVVNRIITAHMESIVDDLQHSVRDGDLVVVTSDHGFIELDPGACISVPREMRGADESSASAERVPHRYLANQEHPAGLRVPFQGDKFFSVARGRAWFKGEGARVVRYSHGGISLSEMVVPGVTLQRVTAPTIRIEVLDVPRHLEVLEREPEVTSIRLRNTGNRAGNYTVSFQANTDRQPQVISGTLQPREVRSIPYAFTPVVSPQRTDHLTLHVSYIDIDGQEKRLGPWTVRIATEERKDVVELGFAGLDELDKL